MNYGLGQPAPERVTSADGTTLASRHSRLRGCSARMRDEGRHSVGPTWEVPMVLQEFNKVRVGVLDQERAKQFWANTMG